MKEPLVKKPPSTIRSRIAGDVAEARAAARREGPDRAWRLLEEAHILSQPYAMPHVRVHLAMLGVARRTDRKPVRRPRSAPVAVLILAIVVLGLLAACGGSSGEQRADDDTTTTVARTAASPPATAARPTETVDDLVAVGGARLHVRCSGTGDTTVLLLAGFTGGADDWAAVERSIGASTRVCAYDRFGIGQSDPPPVPQTFETQAKDLRSLLLSIGEVGPYVVVGHSFGGPEAVTFASLFPEDVDGLLLLDASPPTWNSTICAVGDDGSATAAALRDLCASQAAPANNPEGLAAPRAFADVGKIASLDDLPMIVATAPARSGIDGLSAPAVAGLNAAWDAGQEHWASLSTASRLVTVDGTGHYIQDDQPAVVLDLIDELVQ
jgi:pimeloyl-ACP methyl ester carboxylesterase